MPVVRAAKETWRAPPPRRPRWIAVALIGAGVALVGGGASAYVLLDDDAARAPVAAAIAIDASAPLPPDAGAPVVEVAPVAPVEVEARACPDHSGRWGGTWSASTQRGSWTAEFREARTEDGTLELHGDIRVTGTTCGTGGHIVGHVLEDCSVAFDPYRTGPCRVRYTATFEGETMHGMMSAYAYGMADSGRWHGTRRGPLDVADPP